jgi:hypothetical protein
MDGGECAQLGDSETDGARTEARVPWHGATRGIQRAASPRVGEAQASVAGVPRVARAAV